MQHAVESTARAAAAAGAVVREVDTIPLLDEANAAFGMINRYEAFRTLAFEYDNHREALGPMVRALIKAGADISADDYDAAQRGDAGRRPLQPRSRGARSRSLCRSTTMRG